MTHDSSAQKKAWQYKIDNFAPQTLPRMVVHYRDTAARFAPIYPRACAYFLVMADYTSKRLERLTAQADTTLHPEDSPE